MRTQVGIVGAGPAGLLLSHLLHLNGIESVVLEARSREYVENRIRAGVLEHPVEQLLIESGVGARMQAEGLAHEGVILRTAGRDHRIDFRGLTGKHVMVYSQHNVVQDLIAARVAAGGDIRFDARDVSVHDVAGTRPQIRFEHDGKRQVLDCDIVAGCDGFHGICRDTIPAASASHSSATIPSAGSASSPTRRRRRGSWSIAATRVASHCSRCARLP